MNKLSTVLGLGLFVLSTAPLCADVMVGISGPHLVHYRHHHRHGHHGMMSHGERGDRGNGGHFDGGHDHDGGHDGGQHH